MRVLTVDDDDAFRRRIGKLLESRGCAVDGASSITEALGLIGSERYDAIVLDLKMPGPSALDNLAEIRSSQPQSKIVILTGYGSVATTAAAFKLGIDEYLTKPFSSQELFAALGIDSSEATMLQKKAPYPTLEDVERDYVNRVLNDCDGNISHAAKLLGLHRRSLQRKLAR